MTSALLAVLLVLAAAPPRGRQPVSRFQAGQDAFMRGEFQSALKALDAAAAETSDPSTLAKVHLLRGQCFAAQDKLEKSENAFALALENNPEIELDPERVDPALVRVLDRLRDRLQGELEIRTQPPGAKVWVEGQAVGTTPYKGPMSIGRRAVKVTSPDGKLTGAQDVVVHLRRPVSVEVPMAPVSPPPAPPESARSWIDTWRPFADLRIPLNPLDLSRFFAFEVGGGVEAKFLRGSLYLQLYPEFGVIPRGAFTVPIGDEFKASATLEMPFLFVGEVAFGVGGVAGAEYIISKWFGVYADIGLRHFFTGPLTENQLTLQLGGRLRLP